jgi:hypothetical protein
MSRCQNSHPGCEVHPLFHIPMKQRVLGRLVGLGMEKSEAERLWQEEESMNGIQKDVFAMYGGQARGNVLTLFRGVTVTAVGERVAIDAGDRLYMASTVERAEALLSVIFAAKFKESTRSEGVRSVNHG